MSGRHAPGRASAPRYTAARLVRRQLAAEPATGVLVAATVLVVSFVLSLWPRAVDTLLGDDLHEQLDSLTPAQRDLSGRIAAWFPNDPEPGALGSVTGHVSDEIDGAAQHADWLDQLESSRGAAGDQLQHVLGIAEAVATRPSDPIEKGERATDVVAENLAIRTDPRVGERVRLVEGRAPAAFEIDGLFDDGTPLEAVRDRPLELMTSVDTADRMRWAVGESRTMTGVVPLQVTLVGTFEAVDPGAGYWSHLESTLFPHIIEDGNYGTTVNGIAYADPSALGALVLVDGVALDFWYTSLTERAATTDRPELLRELRAFLDEARMTSELTARLEDVTARHATFTGLLQVLAIGPVGVALAVLWLAAVLAVERRRGALALAAVRGASRTGIRATMAAQGLLIGVPPAALGAWAASVLVPRPAALLGVGLWALPVAVGLAPAVCLAIVARPATRAGRPGRPGARRTEGATAGHLGTGRRSDGSRRRVRLGLELGVVALAAFAAWTARQRGFAAGASTSGTDPLLLAGPVLLALAGGLVALRLYPVPLRLLTQSLHARRRLPHFLGAAEATRSAPAGLAALVALVLAVGVAVFSGVTASTARAGVEQTVAAAVGADLVLEGTDLPPDAADRVAALDGVAHVAAIGNAGRAPGRLLGSDGRVDVITVDVDDVAAVQAALPGVAPLPTLAAAGDDGVPAIIGGRDPEDVDTDAEAFVRWGADLAEIAFTPVAAARSLPGLTSGSAWVVVDAETWAARTGAEPAVGRVLVDLAPGASPTDVAAAARTALGGTGADRPGIDEGLRIAATSTSDVRASVEDRALVRGLTVGLLAAALLSGLLAAVVLGLALAIRGPDRGRLVALLATVGAPRGTTWRLVAWEVVPMVAVGLVTGAGVAAALRWVVLDAADLRPFTGGLARPPATVDPMVPLLVGAVAVVVAVGAVALAAVSARGTRAVVVLREGERP